MLRELIAARAAVADVAPGVLTADGSVFTSVNVRHPTCGICAETAVIARARAESDSPPTLVAGTPQPPVSANSRLPTLNLSELVLPPLPNVARREAASTIYDGKPRPTGSFRRVLFGYARVSTVDQNPDHQTDALRRAGVADDNIYVDHASGAKASRPQLDNVLRLLRDGDTLKITRLDRLGRSVLHLVTLGAELRERGVGLHVIEQGIDTTTAEGRAMFGMLSVLAELQRELIVANTRDGLAAARARGRKGGRRPKLNPEQITLAQQLYDAGEHTVQQIADIFNVPRTTIYGHLEQSSKGKRPAAQLAATGT